MDVFNDIKSRSPGFLAIKLWIALALVIFLIGLGFCGYFLYFGYNPVDAFYMTIITIGTVGFGEVEPLNAEGKIFTSILILLSIFIFAYSVTNISAYFVSINSLFDLKQKKMQSKIDKLMHHVIICGYGRNGKQAAKKLLSFGKDFVVIERHQDNNRSLSDDGILIIEGNATVDETLIKAGIHRADYLITTIPSDADNVFITLSAKQLNNKIKVISRVSDESSTNKMKIAGVNNVIMPDKIGGDHMASLIVAPDLVEFIDNLSTYGSEKMNIQEIVLTNLSHFNTLQDLNIKKNTGCTIIGYKTKVGEYIINPDPDQRVESGGRVIVLGKSDQILKLNQIFKIR